MKNRRRSKKWRPPPPFLNAPGRQVEINWTRKYPPPPYWDRRAVQPNHIKFRTCSGLPPMWNPPINLSVELIRGPSRLIWKMILSAPMLMANSKAGKFLRQLQVGRFFPTREHFCRFTARFYQTKPNPSLPFSLNIGNHPLKITTYYFRI